MSTYVPISLEEHKNKRWFRHSSLAFTKNEVVAPIFVGELASAAHAMTIAFVKNENSVSLVAVMGLRTGENLLFSSDGRWLSTYIPMTYRVRPFQLLSIPNNPEQQVLCIEESHLTDAYDGEPLFDESGKITSAVSEIFEIAKHYSQSRKLTEIICDQISKYNILAPWEITISDGDQQYPVSGLYKINETALNELDNESFLDLRQTGALPVIYAQLYAMTNITILGELIKSTQPKKVSTPATASETFNFSGLN